MTTYHLRNESGIEVFTGTISPAPGGGSQPGGIYKVDAIFNEPGAAHADLTASVPIPAGSTVLEVALYPLAAGWPDTPALDIGDTLNGASSYYNAVNFGGLTAYDPTSNGNGISFLTLQQQGNLYANASPFPDPPAAPGSTPGGGVLYDSDDAVDIVVSGIVGGGGGGQLLVRVWIMAPSTAIVAA